MAIREHIAHDTLRHKVPEITAALMGNLGPTLVAYIANTRSRALPAKWAAGTVIPRQASQERLLAAHMAWETVAKAEGADIARLWFIGANPRLGDEAPATRLREGDAPTVLAAARAMAEDQGGW